MNQPPEPSSIYQLRIVLREISPLIWRRLLICSDTTLAHLHTIFQIVFDWSGEHLHTFHIHGKDYGSNGADTRQVPLSAFRLRRGERFRYIYDYGAHWQCDIRLEARLPREAKRFYPVCIAAKRAAPPEECGGAWAYMARLDQHHYHPPVEAMLVAADAVQALLDADPQTSVRDAVRKAVGSLDALQDAVDCLEVYHQFQPEHVDRRAINAHLRAWPWQRGEAL
jgi:Plasmid pRiA4b ORF-3-like protein